MFPALPLLLSLTSSIPGPAPAVGAGNSRPAEVARRLAEAASRFEEGIFSGEYLKTTRTEVISLSGRLLGEEVETVRVSVRDGWQSVELVRALKGGKDVTGERRKTFTPEPPGMPGGAPFCRGETAVVFGPLALPPGECGASFAPARAGDTGAAGRLAWDCETLAPLWAELTPVDAPAELSEPRIRLDFARSGGFLYAARYTLEGLAADGEMTVRMRLTLEISDFRPAG
jgi:hypothetical protein